MLLRIPNEKVQVQIEAQGCCLMCSYNHSQCRKFPLLLVITSLFSIIILLYLSALLSLSLLFALLIGDTAFLAQAGDRGIPVGAVSLSFKTFFSADSCRLGDIYAFPLQMCALLAICRVLDVWTSLSKAEGGQEQRSQQSEGPHLERFGRRLLPVIVLR